jgi:hypothetical protein
VFTVTFNPETMNRKNTMQNLAIVSADLKQFLVSVTHPPMGGQQALFHFPNNYGASVVCSPYSHGLELAVIAFDKEGGWSITYSTPITSDVIGYIESGEELTKILHDIKLLES